MSLSLFFGLIFSREQIKQENETGKGEFEVAHGCKCNGHYCKVNVLISHSSHFLQELSPMSLDKTLNPARWLLLSLLTIMPATCLKCKMDKGGQKWQVANNTAGQLQYWKLDLIWHGGKANSIQLGAQGECKYRCPVHSSRLATWPNNISKQGPEIAWFKREDPLIRTKPSFSFSELLATSK